MKPRGRVIRWIVGSLALLGAGLVVWATLAYLRPGPFGASPQPPRLRATLGQDGRLDNHRNVAGLAFSPNGRILASAGGEGRIKLWDMLKAR